MSQNRVQWHFRHFANKLNCRDPASGCGIIWMAGVLYEQKSIMAFTPDINHADSTQQLLLPPFTPYGEKTTSGLDCLSVDRNLIFMCRFQIPTSYDACSRIPDAPQHEPGSSSEAEPGCHLESAHGCLHSRVLPVRERCGEL